MLFISSKGIDHFEFFVMICYDLTIALKRLIIFGLFQVSVTKILYDIHYIEQINHAFTTRLP